jgi:anti-anti-sigma factor
VHVLPAAGVLSEVAIARLLGEALEEGYAGLRVCADVEAGLDVLGTRGYEEFELSADRLCRTRRLSVLCLYSAARTVGAVLRGATAAHSGGLRAPGVLTRATGPGELLVEGDVDPVNGPAVAAAVLAAPATTEGDLRVDLSRLGLLGSAGVRALLDGSRPLRAAGGRLVLHRVPSHAERVLRSCAVDSVAGVRWTEGAA